MMKIINVVELANGLGNILKCKHFSSQSRTELGNEEQGASNRHVAWRHAGLSGSLLQITQSVTHPLQCTQAGKTTTC